MHAVGLCTGIVYINFLTMCNPNAILRCNALILQDLLTSYLFKVCTVSVILALQCAKWKSVSFLNKYTHRDTTYKILKKVQNNHSINILIK